MQLAIIGSRGYPSYYGGFETLVRKLAPYLADRGWDVTVYSRPGQTAAEDPDTDSRVHNPTSWGIESRSLSAVTYGASSSLRAVRGHPDAALVLNVANGFWLPLLRLGRVPTLVNVDGIEWERKKWGRVARLVFKAGALATALFGTELVMDSQAISRRWQEDYGRSGVYIPYGGDIPEQAAAVPLDLVSGKYVLVVARLVPENSVEEFLEAARILAPSRDIVIVGSAHYGGALDAAVRELASTYDRVHWLGSVSDDNLLHALWSHAGVYFHGHSVGGTNPALVQAMACGAPVVARKTAYNEEVLADAGVLVEPEPQAIVEALEALLNDPTAASELGQRAQIRVREAFSWESVCERYAQELVRLVRDR